jgi:LuxR family maltose regulon positive regulatory protein
MPETASSYPIIRTKLFRPEVVSDLVPRPRLFKKLDKGNKCSLTLVSAPAGYGKSVLVSSWLKSSDLLHSWLSLDEEMKDLNIFLHYFITAVRKLFPAACPNIFSLINTSGQPSLPLLTTELINELSEIKTPFILALDDYGHIHDPDIHELLNNLLKHLPRNLQLVLMTRRDPPLSLASLCGSGDMINIRQADLKFTKQEISEFLNNQNIDSLDEKALETIIDVTEGWPVGLRLLGLSVRHKTEASEFLRAIRGNTRGIQDYLMAEVLSRQSTEMRNYLLKTSILNRLCPSLCEALCGKDHIGEEFIQQLINSNLFCIPLDEQHTWVRYHHIFQDLLQVQLERRYDQDEINDLYKKASAWFEEHGYLEEALDYALKADSPSEAAEILVRHKQEMSNKEQWVRIISMLELFPAAIIEQNIDLLILHARSLNKLGQYSEWGRVLDRAEKLLDSLPDRGKEHELRLGEILVMRCALFYNSAQPQKALDAGKRALELLPPESSSERVFTIMMSAVSRQMIGDQQGADEMVYEALQKEAKNSPTFHGRLLQTICFMKWMSSDMYALKQTATAMLELCRTPNLPETKVFALYFLGAAQYQLNELDTIEQTLAPVTDNPFGPTFFIYMCSIQILSLTSDTVGRPDQAQKMSDSLIKRILNGEGLTFLSNTQALRDELALRHGRLTQAVHGAKEITIENAPPGYRFMIPELTVAKVFLNQKTEKSLKQAEELLGNLHDYFTSAHNTRFLIEVLSLQALLQDAQGNEREAVSKLVEALKLAEPGGLIRMFVDLGPDMARLLERLTDNKTVSDYAKKLLVEFEKYKDSTTIEKVPASQESVMGSEESQVTLLTNREQEIIELFAKRLSDKEIADRLYISYGTVKKHAVNIYRKLDVKGRRQAVNKAAELGIVRQS